MITKPKAKLGLLGCFFFFCFVKGVCVFGLYFLCFCFFFRFVVMFFRFGPLLGVVCLLFFLGFGFEVCVLFSFLVWFGFVCFLLFVYAWAAIFFSLDDLAGGWVVIGSFMLF